jgi:transposase-like protein
MSKGRTFTVEEKLRILEEARAGGSVAEVCRRYQIGDGQFYRWEAQAKQGMREGLAPKKPGQNGQATEVARLQAELQRKNHVIAELTEALVQEKKGLSDYLRRPG